MKVIGICGRQGAGKTTMADFLTGGTRPSMQKYENPWAYVLSTLFGFSYLELNSKLPRTKSRVVLIKAAKDASRGCRADPVWHLRPDEALIYVLNTLDNVFPDNITNHVPWTFIAPITDIKNQPWVEVSLADPLKKICAAITGIDYKILLGADSDSRYVRENQKFQIGSTSLTGRELLEQVGTNAFRNHFDPDFWLKIAERNIIQLKETSNVVIPDIRFDNELEMLYRVSGKLITICRDPADLILSEDDKKTHPAKWNFLTFCQESQILENSTTIPEFEKKIFDITNT